MSYPCQPTTGEPQGSILGPLLFSLAAQIQTTLTSKLEALQCHFIWDMDTSGSKLFRLRERFEDFATEDGHSWLGHIYNLRGFIEYKLGFTEEAQSFFNKATEAFCQMRNADEGPWLVVNYGNLAWLHHHLGDPAESEAYLKKVDALMKKYPSPFQDELHPEICAEKAWTLMRFSKDKMPLALDYFLKAIEMQPDMVEWNTCHILGLMFASEHSSTAVGAIILEKMRIAKEKDPKNLYLAVHYLGQCAKKGERIEDEARELAREVLRNPVSRYSGIKPLLIVYRNYLSVDEAIDLSEEVLENHPDERYLKGCAALCYRWKIFDNDSLNTTQSLMDRAISLHEEMISLYPHSSLKKKIDLANIYAKSTKGQAKAEQIYQELLERDLEPADKQMLYNNYAKYLNFDRKEYQRSLRYHMKAAEIPQQSFFRENSIKVLEKIRDKGRDRMCREIEKFLEEI
ncbi:interferon-induced protein with tetratricopeptide repeats 1-like [Cottoperca gobio]|uniref:Interferon-induced protein with tetratricopeptide repeats 1-like n=1 Tax=Cottoperca gobio TaxID=56716 RepID=A0A6J2PII7_COTGO|nr:interferon-induced protein with tetratricopeptide repeats 1-like [Cottoperca gobio]